MDAKEINFGPDLQHPTAYLVGAYRLYGRAYVDACIAAALVEVYGPATPAVDAAPPAASQGPEAA